MYNNLLHSQALGKISIACNIYLHRTIGQFELEGPLKVPQSDSLQ